MCSTDTAVCGLHGKSVCVCVHSDPSVSVAVVSLKRTEFASAAPEALSPHLSGNCAAGMRVLFSPELTQ